MVHHSLCHKWFRDLAISQIIVQTMEGLGESSSLREPTSQHRRHPQEVSRDGPRRKANSMIEGVKESHGGVIGFQCIGHVTAEEVTAFKEQI